MACARPPARPHTTHPTPTPHFTPHPATSAQRNAPQRSAAEPRARRASAASGFLSPLAVCRATSSVCRVLRVPDAQSFGGRAHSSPGLPTTQRPAPSTPASPPHRPPRRLVAAQQFCPPPADAPQHQRSHARPLGQPQTCARAYTCTHQHTLTRARATARRFARARAPAPRAARPALTPKVWRGFACCAPSTGGLCIHIPPAAAGPRRAAAWRHVLRQQTALSTFERCREDEEPKNIPAAHMALTLILLRAAPVCAAPPPAAAPRAGRPPRGAAGRPAATAR
ncbi:MAG: hypothetical protein J3K34DRAFT_441645, partial [Monoraphidium minutum]